MRLRAFEISLDPVSGAVLFAKSAGKARIFAAESAHDAGYYDSVGDAIKACRVKRSPGNDSKIHAGSREGFMPPRRRSATDSEGGHDSE